jgi:hypothetical protein
MWNALFLASILAILGAIGFFLFGPRTSPVTFPTAPLADDQHLSKIADVTNHAKKRIESKLWDLNSQELGASVLSELNGTAEKDHVQVSDFRIEKTTEVGEQREAPFVVVLDGDFKDVMKMLGTLESPDSKLALSMLQMATSDTGPGFIKATVGLTAFLRSVD